MRISKSVIATRLILSLLCCSLLLIITSTALRFYYDYNRGMRSLNARLQEVMASAVPVMADNIWLANWDMVRLQAEGIRGARTIRRVEVTVDGQKMIEIGPESTNGDSPPLVSALTHRYKEQDVSLGSLALYGDEEQIRRQLLGEFFKALGMQVVIILIISSLLFLLFHRLVGRHLTAMAGQLRAFGQGGIKTRLALDKKPAGREEMDEIDQVVSSLNEMQQALQCTFEELRKTNEDLAAENRERLLIEGELRENRSMLRNILDTVPQGIFWKDPEGVYLGCNQVFAGVAGLDDPRQISGRTDLDLPWPENDAEAYRADELEVITNRKGKQHIIRQLQRADGARSWIDSSKVPLFDQQGKVYGVLGVFTDITERVKADEELERYRDHLERLVRERTEEIEKKNAELERRNRLFVGRELRMIELKARNKDLEKKFGEQ